MSIMERLRQTILSKNKTLRDFSDESSIPYTTLQQYLSGSRKPGLDALNSIKTHLSISIDWLLTGDGPMHREQAHQIQAQPAEYKIKRNDEIKYMHDWLDDLWYNADAKKRHWLEIQIGRSFPEYREWREQKTHIKNTHTTHTQNQ